MLEQSGGELMRVETNIGTDGPVSGDRTMSTVADAERAMLEAALFRNVGAGQLRCPKCRQNYFLEELVCPRCGKLDFDSNKTGIFSELMKELTSYVKQPAGDAFAMQRLIVFEVNGARLELPIA